MLVRLCDESGKSLEQSFSNIEEAAKWCANYPEYGITLFPEGAEQEWDRKEWQATLDYYFGQ